jgi:hypothetical protein
MNRFVILVGSGKKVMSRILALVKKKEAKGNTKRERRSINWPR